ncbi:hypothetical protein M3I53_25945 [Paraburkholderia sp. CNPSo 3272]|nr:hypothetical protein [Paraburkholderia sp. CNPSo 3272]MCP3726531.1 hypothetical protein [Paraburkholderia sp. CNPSo 3272]
MSAIDPGIAPAATPKAMHPGNLSLATRWLEAQVSQQALRVAAASEARI